MAQTDGVELNIKAHSYFRDPGRDRQYFRDWVARLEQSNGRTYESLEVRTALGTTQVWGLGTQDTQLETLVIFPGARTTALIWDLDRGLDQLGGRCRIFMVETNGLPNLSDGKTPDIRSQDYGHWAVQVLENLEVDSAWVAGASFGGLIAMKLALVSPEKVKAAFLLNPGCLQPFSPGWRNLYYNLLPLVWPTEANVTKFLHQAIFCKPEHALSAEAEKLLTDYEHFAIRRYKDKTQKPYSMGRELEQVAADTYLLLGDRDLLFPWRRSLENARKHLKNLKEVKLYENVGHGIETYGAALGFIKEFTPKPFTGGMPLL